MSTNDPAKYRCSAANAFIDLSTADDYVGVVGLAGGQAQGWHDPILMTVKNHAILKSTIKQRSLDCLPNGSTPTSDALQKAFNMLAQAAQGTSINGSVILLTDGQPDPNGVEQINSIQNKLVPQFQSQHWKIDTIGLGANNPIAGGPFPTFHDFLYGLSTETGGEFHDDSQGIIQGINALNITPFFLDIFASLRHKSVGGDKMAQTVDGIRAKNFSVSTYTDVLNVVVVKENANISIILKDPGAQSISEQNDNVLISNDDPYYTYFSVNEPRSGSWELDIKGSGRYVIQTLNDESMNLANLTLTQNQQTIADGQPVALNNPVTISTFFTHNGVQATPPDGVDLNGTLIFHGPAGNFSQSFVLQNVKDTRTFSADVEVPASAPSGSYMLTIDATTDSRANSIANTARSQVFISFPEPYLLSSQSQELVPANELVMSKVIHWDPVLVLLYDHLPAWAGFLSAWPLQQSPPLSHAVIQGKVMIEKPTLQPYAPIKQLRVSVLSPNSPSATTVPVQISHNGQFQLLVPVTGSGIYTLQFQTQGQLKDSYGMTISSLRKIEVSERMATPLQEGIAWLFTIAYAYLAFLVIRFVIGVTYPHPSGSWSSSRYGELDGKNIRQAHRTLFQWFFHPDQLTSRQLGMPAGLRFRFLRGGVIKARAEGRDASHWQFGNGDPVASQYTDASDLLYKEDDDSNETVRYTVSAETDEGDSLEGNSFKKGGLFGGKRRDDDMDDPYEL
ncbi:hypothetical protein KDH_12620 [Dictyobacter sp. S3.2.2.5]|uniref:VWFA domain-containing protein n=2 Tax=Dictyobacter halimunensis TaxID=3026934 RepID=A0ABQ6FJM1_9CHLR|nr:hypothetical protein KDH_12620 [Dictyobacter sp. S3.2.2.5]